MKIEEQVTSLELSKKLKELEVKQESLFYWYTSEFGEQHLENKPSDNEEAWRSVSAFTVAELGGMFGKLQVLSGYAPRRLKQFSCKYFYGTAVVKQFEADTEADARATMLIYLLENNLMKIPNSAPEKLAA